MIRDDKYYFISYNIRGKDGRWTKKNKMINRSPFNWLYLMSMNDDVHLNNYIEVDKFDYDNYKHRIDNINNEY